MRGVPRVFCAIGLVWGALLAPGAGAQSGRDDGRRLVVPTQLVAGQVAFGTVVDPAMKPVPNVRLRVDGRRQRTDSTGRFDLPTNRQRGSEVEVRLATGDRRAPGSSASSRVVLGASVAGGRSVLTDVPAYPARGGVIQVLGSGLRVEDGDLQVLFGDTGAAPLAGTPAELIVQVPPEIDLGPTTLRVSSASSSTEALEVQVIGLELRPGETDLIRGEGSRLEVRVLGTEDPVPLTVLNRTPDVIRLEGGDEQAKESSGGVENRAMVTYRGVGEGSWAIFVEAEPRLRVAETEGPSDSVEESWSPDPSDEVQTTASEPEVPDRSPPGTVLPDTGDRLVRGTPAPSRPRDRDEGVREEPCSCRSCGLPDLDLIDSSTSTTAGTLRVGGRFRIQARPVVQCSDGCTGRVDGSWNLTFVPYTSSSQRLFLRRPAGAPVPRGTSAPPLQITGRGDSIEFSPERPGTLVAHFRGRCACGESTCAEPVVASAEWRIGFDALDEAALERLEHELASTLPKIGRGDGRPSLTEVGDWLEQTTTWRRGTLYDQELGLPEGTVGVTDVQVIGRGAANQREGAVDGVLRSGDELRGLANVFDRQQTTWVRVEGEPGALKLRYTAPTVDRFRFRIRTVDAEGRTQELDLVCPGTSGPGGAPVRAPCQVPASGHVRIAVVNVHPSRLEGVLLENLMARLAQGFGASSKLSQRAPAWDAEGRQAVFSHYLFSDFFLCADQLVPHLKGLARALDAEIEVHDHFIVLRGRDLEGPGMVPATLGGRRRTVR